MQKALEKENKYDVDYSSLQKGDYISKEQIEEITGLKWGTTRFQSAILSLKSEMEKNFRQLGFDCVIKQENYGLLICKDDRAVDYLYGRFNSHLTGIGKYTNELRHKVDTTDFNDKDKQSYYKKLQIATEVTESANKTKKKIIGLQSQMERATVINNSTELKLNQATPKAIF